MEHLRVRHRQTVAYHFSGKVEELQYQLSEVIAHCDTSLHRFQTGQAAAMVDETRVRYSFSAFANVLQAFKDAAPTFLGAANFGTDVRTLRHGTFMLESRNAMTHDGHPMVSLWADGRFYVPSKIYRFAFGKLVTIHPPIEDMRTLCLEFASDLCVYLRGLVVARLESSTDDGPILDIEKVGECIGAHPVIPDFVRELFAQHKEDIQEKLATFRPDPLQMALTSVDRLSQYCASTMAPRTGGPQDYPYGPTTGNVSAG